jgi:hypothetical protein
MTIISGLPLNWENLSENDRRRLAPLWQRTIDVDALTAEPDSLAIVGSRPTLIALKAAIEQALAGGDAEIPVTTVDDKPLRLVVRRIDAADAVANKAA